ncbi:MAG: PTS transporter subunit EIIB [Clostridium sp.]|nr:MAG: PTS transporter subunit EIIB [Clostridium sp.]
MFNCITYSNQNEKKKIFHIEINKLIQYLGGKDNIIDAEINLSRLKVRLKDTSIVNKEGIQKN